MNNVYFLPAGHVRPRDSQRQKLYNAEREALKENYGGKVGNGMIADVQGMVDRLCQQHWFQARWGQRTIEVRQKTSGRATGYYNSHICMPPRYRSPYITLHEVAHVLCHPKYAGHGPEYAALYLFLVHQHLGADASASLRESFRKHGVKYREGVPSLPPPKKPVVTQKQVKEQKRKDSSRPLSKMEAQSTASCLRRGVKAGLFGASGTKQRTYALLISRTLEDHNGGI